MKTIYAKQSLPPGSFGLPVVGETISFLRDSGFNEKRHKRYGPIFKTHLFGRPAVIMLGAEANQFLLTNENRYFVVSWPYSTRVLLGPASLSLQIGEEHIKRRKLLAQAFQPRGAGRICFCNGSYYPQLPTKVGTHGQANLVSRTEEIYL